MNIFGIFLIVAIHMFALCIVEAYIKLTIVVRKCGKLHQRWEARHEKCQKCEMLATISPLIQTGLVMCVSWDISALNVQTSTKRIMFEQVSF